MSKKQGGVVKPTPVELRKSSENLTKKWEYLQIFNTIYEQELNNLGEQGWELVNFVVERGTAAYVFKRPLINV